MNDWMDAEGHADRAFDLFERGRWAEAEAELRRAIALNPDQPEWHFNLGLTLEHAGRDTEALNSYQRAIQLLPDEPEPLLAASVVANRQGQYQLAKGWLEQAIRLEPQCEEAYVHKIESHLRSGELDDAETTFYMAQQSLNEPGAACFAIMAEVMMLRRQYQRAEWCLKEALRIDPTMPRLQARLAALMAAAGKHHRALHLYLRELRQEPGNIETLIDYGGLLHDLGRYPEAAEKYRRVLEIEPANVDAHYRLGQIAMAQHRFDQAALEFELVLKLDGHFPGIRIALGEAALQRGLLGEARSYLLEECAAIHNEGKSNRDSAIGNREHDVSDPLLPAADSLSPMANGLRPAAWRIMPGFLLAHLGHLLLEVNEPAKAAELYEMALETWEEEFRYQGPEALSIRHEASGDKHAVGPESLMPNAFVPGASTHSASVPGAFGPDAESQRIELLRQLALARFRAGDRDRGAAVSRRVLRHDPLCLRSIHNLAFGALQQNRLRMAAGWIQRGLRINKHDDGLRRLRMRLWLALAREKVRCIIALIRK